MTTLPHPAVRLRRMRWRLAVLFSVFNVAGLVMLGAVAAAADSHGRTSTLRAQIRGMAALADDNISDASGPLVFDKSSLREDSMGDVAIYVFTSDATGKMRLADSADPDPNWDPQLLAVPARWAQQQQMTSAFTDVAGTKGRGLALAIPLYHTTGPQNVAIGAIVAVGRPNVPAAAHNRVLWTMVAAGSALTVAAALGGFLLARRSVRLATQTLDQQEKFLADAAHELRTPLAAIRSAAEAAIPDETGQAAALTRVAARAAAMGTTVEDLLLRARHVAGLTHIEPQKLRLDLLAEDVAESDFPEPYRLTADLEPTVVVADPALVRMAVRNLVDNAVRHGCGEGPAQVELTVRDGTVSVRDHGPGIGAAGIREGVGLSLVRWVAETHHASLEVVDAMGGGTVAVLSLPR